MKCLKRNMVSFKYLAYSGEETDLNDDSEHTGEYYPAHENAKTLYGNFSAPSGQVNQTFYGEDIRYTHILVMDHDAGIDEHGLIRKGGEDYDVVAVRPSLNFVSIALRKRTVDHVPTPGPEPKPEPDEEPEGITGETGYEEPIYGETGGEEPIYGETGAEEPVYGETGNEEPPEEAGEGE